MSRCGRNGNCQSGNCSNICSSCAWCNRCPPVQKNKQCQDLIAAIRPVTDEFMRPLPRQRNRGITTLKSDDEDSHFIQTLMPYIKKLNAEKKLLVRVQFQEIIYKFIYNTNLPSEYTEQGVPNPKYKNKFKPLDPQDEDNEFYCGLIPYFKTLDAPRKLQLRMMCMDVLYQNMYDPNFSTKEGTKTSKEELAEVTAKNRILREKRKQILADKNKQKGGDTNLANKNKKIEADINKKLANKIKRTKGGNNKNLTTKNKPTEGDNLSQNNNKPIRKKSRTSLISLSSKEETYNTNGESVTGIESTVKSIGSSHNTNTMASYHSNIDEILPSPSDMLEYAKVPSAKEDEEIVSQEVANAAVVNEEVST